MWTGLTRKDAHGIPMEACGRCAGDGTYPSTAWDGVCLGCNGSGWVYPAGRVAKLATQWANVHRVATSVVLTACRAYAEDGSVTVTQSVEPGDEVRFSFPGSVWRTIAAIDVTTDVRGSAYVGLEGEPGRRLISEWLATNVTFTDGETIRVDASTVWTRRLTPEVKAELAAIVAAAQKSYATLLKARAAREVKAAAKRAEQAAERERQEAEAESVTLHLLETHPELADLLTDRYADATGFMASMRDKLNAGAMTEKMITAAVDAVKRDRAKDNAKANAHAAGVTVPTARIEFIGTVTATWAKWSDEGYGYHRDGGYVYKMRVEHPDGWSAAGTIPAALLDWSDERPTWLIDATGTDPNAPTLWLRGKTIKIKATFKPSDNDPLSGWFSRPKVEVLEPAAA